MATSDAALRDAARQVIRTTAGRLGALAPAVTDMVVTEVRAAVPQSRRLPVETHRRLVRHGLDTSIGALRSGGDGRPDLAYAAEVGRRCADAGLPVDLVLRTYRAVGRRLWDAVIGIVADADPAGLPVLAYAAAEFWQVVDEQSVIAAEAFQEARWERLRRSRERTRALLEALLAGRGDDPDVVRAATAALGLPERGRYTVVVARGPVDTGAADGGGLRLMWATRADREVALVELGDRTLAGLAATLRGLVSGQAGIGPVVNRLSDLGQACRLAEITLRTCAATGAEVARFDQRLPAALVAAQPDLGRELAGTLDPAGTLTTRDRALLVTSFTTWLDCDGSVSRTAARLYCHRNTVTNRIRRLFAASGRDVDRPWHLVEVTLAVLATRVDPTAGAAAGPDATPRSGAEPAFDATAGG